MTTNNPTLRIVVQPTGFIRPPGSQRGAYGPELHGVTDFGGTGVDGVPQFSGKRGVLPDHRQVLGGSIRYYDEDDTEG